MIGSRKDEATEFVVASCVIISTLGKFQSDILFHIQNRTGRGLHSGRIKLNVPNKKNRDCQKASKGNSPKTRARVIDHRDDENVEYQEKR